MATAEMIKELENYRSGMESLVAFWGKAQERWLEVSSIAHSSYAEGCKDVYALIVEDIGDFIEAAKR